MLQVAQMSQLVVVIFQGTLISRLKGVSLENLVIHRFSDDGEQVKVKHHILFSPTHS
jgi:hypothetical protein